MNSLTTNDLYLALPSGLASARPVAGINGRSYFATDTGVLSRDNGSAWVTVANSRISNQALTDGASIAWDVANGPFATVTIAGDRTLANPTNLAAGASYAIKVTQGSGGSHLLAYGNAYRWAGGTAPTLSTAAAAIDIITFISDGTYLYGSCLKAFA